MDLSREVQLPLPPTKAITATVLLAPRAPPREDNPLRIDGTTPVPEWSFQKRVLSGLQ